jgi:hypothetical protein
LKFWLERGARINSNLFILIRAWLNFQQLFDWRSEVKKGKLHFFIDSNK